MIKSKPLEQQFELSDEAVAVSDSLRKIIEQKTVDGSGFIPFSEFMQAALYYPELGYYQNRQQKFGESGDFITAPEMGKAFAYSLAHCMQDYLVETSNSNILEIGAGSGILAVNLTKSLSAFKSLPQHYFILEPSPQLQAQQRALIAEMVPEHLDMFVWLKSLPTDFNGIILANEVLDAIPCERVVLKDKKWHRVGVGIEQNELVELLRPIDSLEGLPKPLLNIDAFPDGYETEYRPLLAGWLKALAHSITCGAILLIDYGYNETEYYHPQRVSGSLSCFVRHKVHSDPLKLVGLQDITAHVDFSHVAQLADLCGLEVRGYTTQAGFLLENGITEFNQLLAEELPEKARYRLSQELQMLLMPGQMGEVIKVISIATDNTIDLKGFELQDHRHRL